MCRAHKKYIKIKVGKIIKRESALRQEAQNMKELTGNRRIVQKVATLKEKDCGNDRKIREISKSKLRLNE